MPAPLRVMTLLVSGWTAFMAGAAAAPLHALEEVVQSRRDLWGEAAMRQPNGPSYEFFAPLLPPPRYVNADFKHYPIVLSAPSAPVKARLISNGSGLNTPGNTRSWRDPGTAVTFRVGPDELRFGEYLERVDGPRYAEGWLPIVEVNYTHDGAVHRQESFASVEQPYADLGVVLVRFTLAQGTNAWIAVQVDSPALPVPDKGRLLQSDAQQRVPTDDVRKSDAQERISTAGKVLLWHEGGWQWTRQRLVGRLQPGKPLTLAIATKSADVSLPSPLADGGYERQRALAKETWTGIVQQGLQVSVPEPVVNHAWRALLVGTHALIQTNRMHYSAGNQYDQLYQAEGCDAVEALLAWGHTNDARRLIPAQLAFTRKGLEYHQAGHKLQLLTLYHALTGDAALLRESQARWEKELTLIHDHRTNGHGLFPRERYCGDIPTPVFSLNSNAKCWRALRDFAHVLRVLGETTEAARAEKTAAEFRAAIQAAVKASVRRDTQPPFIPIALSGEEEPPLPITGTRIGSYWNLMAPYVLGTGVFGPGAPEEQWLLDYQRRQGGLCMGMIRCQPNVTFWTGPHSVNPLYGLRHTLIALRRDEPDHALASFYGMLAQGFTRDTFIGAEGASLTPLDAHGRLFYCPPNSAANAAWIQIFRGLLVQDWDLDDNGRPETLRLMFAAPRRWLDNGKSIEVKNAPTSFGNVSTRTDSQLNTGRVTIAVTPPEQQPRQTLLRVRIPDGWKIESASIGKRPLKVDGQGTVDVSGERQPFSVAFKVAPAR